MIEESSLSTEGQRPATQELSEITGVMWDYDNTMAWTESTALEAACELTNRTLLAGLAPYPLDEFVERFKGTSFREIAPTIARERGFAIEASVLEKLVVLEREGAIRALENVMPVRNIRPAQAECESLGVDQIVVSSSNMQRLIVCLEATGQNQRFDSLSSVFSAESSLIPPEPKPSPAIYRYAMAARGLDPARAMAIEDSNSGLDSARGAGVAVLVGFVGALAAEEQLQVAQGLFEHGARWVVDDPMHVPKIIADVKAGNVERLDKFFGRDAWSFTSDTLRAMAVGGFGQ